MNDNISKLTYGVICLVVVVLLIAVTIVPVIEDAQKDQYSTDNNTQDLYVIVAENNATAENPVTLEISDDGFLIVNGAKDTQSFDVYNEKIWVNNGSIRVRESSGSYFFGATIWSDATTSTTQNVGKLVYNGSVLTGYGADESTVFTVNSDFFIYPYSKGTYGEFDMRQATARDATHINKDATVFIGTAGNPYGFLKGNYTDGFQNIGYTGDATRDQSTITYTSTLSEDGLTWTFATKPVRTLSDSTSTVDPTTNDWLLVYAPIEYSYISDNDSMIISLLGVIPLVMFVIPVMLAVNMITPRRD